ncbi:hypothetical protein NKG05_08225 [Oerskovia sp. M15]
MHAPPGPADRARRPRTALAPPVANALPTRDPFLEPGEMLVAHVADTPKGPRVLAAEKVAPPLH